MKIACLVLAWVSVAATIEGFVLPWAMIEVREPGMVKQFRQATPFHDTVGGLTKDLGRIAVKIRRGAEVVTGELPSLADLPKQVSGAQIPQVANQEQAKLVTALVELLTNQRQGLGAKSYLVYLVPGLAVLFGLLLTGLGGRWPVVAMIIAVLCASLAAMGFLKLTTTNTRTLFIAITIGRGLWLSLWGYVGLAVAASGLSLLKRR